MALPSRLSVSEADVRKLLFGPVPNRPASHSHEWSQPWNERARSPRRARISIAGFDSSRPEASPGRSTSTGTRWPRTRSPSRRSKRACCDRARLPHDGRVGSVPHRVGQRRSGSPNEHRRGRSRRRGDERPDRRAADAGLLRGGRRARPTRHRSRAVRPRSRNHAAEPRAQRGGTARFRAIRRITSRQSIEAFRAANYDIGLAVALGNAAKAALDRGDAARALEVGRRGDRPWRAG